MSMRFAPPPKTVDGLNAAPIDITAVDAKVVLNAATQVAAASATMSFEMGSDPGNPIFDLRQTIDSAKLDGVPIAPSSLAHHNFNGDWNSRLRVVEQHLPAGSSHVLELSYTLGQPAAGGSQAIGWQSSPAGVTWDFWFSDLWAARYLEMWFPSNLVYDEFSFTLELELDDAATPHTLITNGGVTELSVHHWRVEWPADTSSFAPMLYLTPTNKLESYSSDVSLPGVGTVTLDLHKLNTVSTSLAGAAGLLATKMLEFNNDVGPYMHGDRFTALLWSGGRSMEYNGGTTTAYSAMVHETFHSWFARGVKPATQNDSWLDEAWTVYNTSSTPFTSVPLNAWDPPVQLHDGDPYKRTTPSSSYSAGNDFFAGLAAELGVGPLRALMKDFYVEYAGRGVSTEELAGFLIRATGRVDLADLFHQFVYGYWVPSTGPDLYLKDAPGDPGSVPYSGMFWRSPDVWVRNQNDGGTAHEDPEFGQDNWFNARVRNRSAVTARTFVVTFTVKAFAGTQFVYPGDWAPFYAVAFGTDLPGHATKVVAARWPRALVPPPDTHGCLLAQVYTPDDPAARSVRVWEDNNLAQRNLRIVDLVPNASADIAVRFGSTYATSVQHSRIELIRPRRWSHMPVALVFKNPEQLAELMGTRPPRTPWAPRRSEPGRVVRLLSPTRAEVAIAGRQALGLQLRPGSTIESYRDAPEPIRTARVAMPTRWLVEGRRRAAVSFPGGTRAAMAVRVMPSRPVDGHIRVTAPATARPGEQIDLDVVQRNEAGAIIGGVGIRMHILATARGDSG